MSTAFDRRNLLKVAGAAAAMAALPTRAFAQASPLSERDRKLLDIARREVDRAGSTLWRTDIVGIADYGVHSAIPRFHFVNLEAGNVRSFLVAHGTGSDPDHSGFLQQFSNIEGSNATSRGAYITWEWYKGRYGTSIRLGGLDQDNSNALPRAIVMHSADYATQAHVEKWGRLGRSNGCFAMSPEDFNEALWHLSGGRLLYADRLGLV
ncbi:murein L,D-transpeptidase catalytic domain family protein [Altererythrobacter sp. CC-YST694]|uniref:murein L,D-transpeptidase catalytic domain-containing protein n=1 Tax=Altererythrobacter sp. CC-YST694 TaxID=2755038 RepID=UPI001D026D28|nr:murein L,D-transpeptidase catalytic domain family protein [Altererythrobacter sp. CC-YST694]MCB5425796.1 murein L,D-transpeptidase catalytic domain family protein [Altererythrobacter sp. CC-YST694]